jgi:hypothetical protein
VFLVVFLWLIRGEFVVNCGVEITLFARRKICHFLKIFLWISFLMRIGIVDGSGDFLGDKSKPTTTATAKATADKDKPSAER